MAYQYDENQGFRPEGAPPPPPPRKSGSEKNNNELGSWIFIIVMLGVAWPVGLILLISKLSGSSGRKDRAPRQTASQAGPKVQQTVQQVTKTPVYTDKSTKTMKTIGIILAALGGVTLLSGLGSNMAALLGGAGFMEYYVQRHGDLAVFSYSVMSVCLIFIVGLALLTRVLGETTQRKA